jgi:hypothetical protein
MDNKGCCLISYDALAMPAMNHGLVLILFFESKPNLLSVSLSSLFTATWLFGL